MHMGNARGGALGDERFGSLGLEVDVEHHLGIGVDTVELVGQSVNHLLLGSHIEVGYLALLYGLAIGEESPAQLVVIDVAEEVLIVNLYLASLGVDGLCPYVLILVTDLVGMRIEFAVGADEAIVVEVLVIIAVPVVVVAGIGKDFHTVGVFLAESLVYEVPDETTLICRIFANPVTGSCLRN